MEALICTCCGGTKWFEDEKYRVCQFCGTKHLKSISELSPPVVPQVTQREPNKSTISINSDVERLLRMCRNDKKNASKYAQLVLDIDPTNKEALKYAPRRYRR